MSLQIYDRKLRIENEIYTIVFAMRFLKKIVKNFR
jgi:hypothetical protein